MRKFNVGDKVVPLSKSVWGCLEESGIWRKAREKEQGFLYITGYENELDCFVCNVENNGYSSGDFFKAFDLVPYTEETNTNNKAEMIIAKLEQLVVEANETIKELKTEKKNKTVSTVNARQLIINEAKDFVEKYKEVKAGMGNKNRNIGNTTAQEYYYETDFVTKGNKVVALVYTLAFGENRKSKRPKHIGKAICCNGDTFNRHIGEAIALGRALDINVDKFISAVQPTEYAVGQVVSGIQDKGCFYSTDNKFTLSSRRNEVSFKYKEFVEDFIYIEQIGAILDDTNANYEV